MDHLASLQIALAAIACCGLLAHRLEASDRCEWGLAVVLLNASALSLWNTGHSPMELPDLWLRHAVAAAAAALALRLMLELRQVHSLTLRRFLAPVSYVALSLGTLLLASPAIADEPAAPLETIPVQALHPEQDDGTVTLRPVEVRGKRGYLLDSAGGGTKTDTPLMETPVSVSAIPREQFDDQGAQTVQDALRYSAGVRSDAYGLDSRGDWTMIRGSEAVYYLDGLRMLFNSYNNVRPDPWTLDSVEIVRGPASVLYGQGPSGGIVNLNSKLPQPAPNHELRAEAGSHERRQVALDSTGRVTRDGSLSYRLVAMQRESGTQVDYVDDDRWLVAPSLSWAPADWLRWTLLGRIQEDDSGSTTAFLPWEGTVLPSRNGRIPTNRFVSEPGFDRYDTAQSALTSMLELQLGESWSFRQNLRYSGSEGRYRSLFPNIYTGDPYMLDPQRRRVLRVSNISDTDTRSLTTDQQLQARFSTAAVEHLLLLGFDYSNTDIDEIYGNLGDTPLRVILQGRFDLFDPVYGRYIAPATARLPTASLRQRGFYLQDQASIGDHWIALLGARHDSASSGTGSSTDSDDSETSLRAGLLYRFDAGFSPYLSYSESFEPVAGRDENGTPYLPVRGKQVEAGLKIQPPGSPTLVTIAAFQTKEENRLAPGPNPQFQVQLGEADLQGLELEALTTLFGRLDLNANYTWIDAESDDGPEAEAAERYKSLPAVAEHTGALWARLRFALGKVTGLSLGGGVRYIGQTTDQGHTVTVPSITLFDAMLGWESQHWRLAVNGTNLEDDSYVATCLERGDCFYGSRRNIVGSLAYKF